MNNKKKITNTNISIKKKLKIKWINVLILIIMMIFFILLVISLVNIAKWFIDNKNTNKSINKLQEITEITEIIDNENTEILNNNEENTEEPNKENIYFDYIKTNLINVDFSKLKAINKDVVGWINVGGTSINYPFVQTTNNEYYLTHSFDKKYNKAGWVFLDYRNNIKENDKNIILYAHSRLDLSMFGTLSDVLKSKWYNDKSNHIIKISTEYENTLWQIFSTYHIKTTSDYIETNFINDTKYQKFIDLITNRSSHNFKSKPSITDKILTLSTCYSEEEKLVVHAKLIKKQTN